MAYRAKCMWCSKVTRPHHSRKCAAAVMLTHVRRQHPRRDSIIVREAIKRSIFEDD